MRLEEHVGNSHMALQIRPLVCMPWIFVVADVKPRPAVESIFAHRSYVVGRQIVAEQVTFVCRTEDRAGARLDRQPRAITDSRCVRPPVLAVWIEGQYVGAPLLLW